MAIAHACTAPHRVQLGDEVMGNGCLWCEPVLDERVIIELCNGHERQHFAGLSPCREVDQILAGHDRPARIGL